MNRVWMASLVILLSSIPARADDPVAAARGVEAAVERIVDKVVPAFVFIGGGSGVCISEDGWFVTNFHVVNSPQGIIKRWRVKTPDGNSWLAEVVGTDTRGDIALVKMKEAKDRPHVDLGDSDLMETGEYVIAVGNPFLLGRPDCRPTVSLGIVSANHRCEGSFDSPKNLQGYLDCIQTDAAVNPGNSGGPLFNMKGELVGINGSISPRFGNRVNTGIGYAIPSNQIKRFIPTLKEGKGNMHGVVDGLTMLPKESAGDGATVGRVKPGSDAEKAGFEKDDLIVEVQGMPTPTLARWWGVVWTWPAGETLAFKVKRGDKTIDVSAKLSPLDEEEKAKQKPYLGLRMETSEDGGIVVQGVSPESPAAKAGVQSGDVIKSIDGKEVKDAGALLKVVGEHKTGDKIKLKVTREGKEIEVEVTLEARK